MTVKQLIKKLSKLPEDAIVTVPNCRNYYDGEYKATEVIYDEDDKTAFIDSDYRKAIWTN